MTDPDNRDADRVFIDRPSGLDFKALSLGAEACRAKAKSWLDAADQLDNLHKRLMDAILSQPRQP